MEIEGEMIHRCPIAMLRENPTAGRIASLWPHYDRGCIAWAVGGYEPTACLSDALGYLAGEVGRVK